MTQPEIDETRQFIQSQIDGLAKPIREHTILLKAYQAGGESMKEMQDKVAAILGSQIAMRESLESQAKELN